MKGTLQKEQRQTDGEAVRQEFVSPDVDIFETGEGYVLQAEMPGVTREGLEITLEGTQITITGHRHPQPLPGQYLFGESQLRDYRRVFELDPAVDTGKIAAKMDQGVLTLMLPKSEMVKPRKITVD